MNHSLGIKEVSKQIGMSVDTLRYYDKIGLISPKRRKNSYRYYEQMDILKLQYLSVMKYAKFSLEESKTILNLLDKEPSEDCKNQALTLLQAKQAEVNKLLTTYTSLLQLLQQSITISQKIESFPEEHEAIDNFVIQIFNALQE